MTTEAEARARDERNAAFARLSTLPNDFERNCASSEAILSLRERIGRQRASRELATLADADKMILRLWCERDIFAGALKQVLASAREQADRQERMVAELRRNIDIINREHT